MRPVARQSRSAVLCGLTLLAAACGSGAGDADGGGTATTAPVVSSTTARPTPAAPPDTVRVAAVGGGTGRVVVVEGMLPTPCHEIAWTAGTPDAGGVVPITLTVTAPTDRVCAQVLTPYRLEIDVALLAPGARAVSVGGTVVPFDATTTTGRP